MAKKTKKSHGQWFSTNMEKAIHAIRTKKMGWKKAAKIYNLPKTTLMRLSYEKYGNPKDASQTKRGRPTVLTQDLEKELAQYCLAMEKNFFGLTRGDLCRMDYQIAERNEIPHPFKKHNMAGKKWLLLFLKRHKKTLSVRRPSGTSYQRAVGFTKEKVGIFVLGVLMHFLKRISS